MQQENNLTEKGEIFRILLIYIAFFLSIPLIFLPSIYASLIGMLVCLFTLIGIFSVRSKAEEYSLTDNHMTYLIKTFWRANLFFLYSVIVSTIYLCLFANYDKVAPCLFILPDRLTDAVMSMDFKAVKILSDGCWKTFVKTNEIHLIVTAIIAFFPLGSYLLFRYFQGWLCAVKGKLIPERKL